MSVLIANAANVCNFLSPTINKVCYVMLCYVMLCYVNSHPPDGVDLCQWGGGGGA